MPNCSRDEEFTDKFNHYIIMTGQFGMDKPFTFENTFSTIEHTRNIIFHPLK